MIEEINHKSPDVIKKGLEHCITGCHECPYELGHGYDYDCQVQVHKDALAYIQQLEAAQPKEEK